MYIFLYFVYSFLGWSLIYFFYIFMFIVVYFLSKVSIGEEGGDSSISCWNTFSRDVGLFCMLECRCKCEQVTTLVGGAGLAVIRANQPSVVKKFSRGRRVGSLGEESGKEEEKGLLTQNEGILCGIGEGHMVKLSRWLIHVRI